MPPKTLSSSLTPYPDSPVVEQPRQKRISDGQWTQIANDCWQMITASYSSRAPLEANIKAWEAMYGLEVEPKDFPWVDCSNIVVPIVPAKLETLLAQVAGEVFVPEFYIVSGNNPDAQREAYEVQRFLNNAFRLQRGSSTWFEEHIKLLHLGLMHGTSVMESMWKTKKRHASFGVRVPVTDEEGMPVFDAQGNVKMGRNVKTKEITEYNDVNLRPVRLRDFMLSPDESISIEDAACAMRCEWLYENDLKAMVEDDLLSEEWVERALRYVPQGLSDVSSDRQGTYDKSIDWQLIIGQGQGLMASEFFRNRGPLKVWRMHSDQFDMDGDGWAEENVFWVHELSQYLLGWCPDQYIAPTRPFNAFSPFPRADRFYGYSLIERLAPFQSEASTLRNQRNDAQDLATSPPLLINRSEEIHDKNMQWGPGKQWAVRDTTNAVKQVIMAQPAPQAYQEEQLINNYADQLSGLSSPSDGASTSSRRSATEVKLKAAATNVRASLIAMLLRITSRSVIQFVWKLWQQNATSDADPAVKLPPEILGLDLNIEVAGINDPLNIEENIQESLEMYNLLRQDPDIMQNAVARYNLKKNLLTATHTHNMEGIIGTGEEAVQRQQQEVQQRQQQAQMQMQMAQQAAAQGKPPQGAPASNGHAPGPPGAASPPQLAAHP